MKRYNQQEDNDTTQDEKFRFPPWLITYSDLITLLLTFFILMMSMADLDPVRFDAASNSLKGAFGIRPTHSEHAPSAVIEHPPPIMQVNPVKSPVINTLVKKLDLEIEQQGLTEQASIFHVDAETILVRIKENLLFEPGQAQLNSESIHFLDKIANSIAEHSIDIRIEGHCDRREADTAEDAALELSTARAFTVLRHYIKNSRINTDRLSAVGYGDTRPLADNAPPGRLTLNRRVDIFLRADPPSGTGSAINDKRNVPL